MISLLNQVALPTLGTCVQDKTLLTDKPLWFTVSCQDDRINIEVELYCGQNIGANQALLQFHFVNDDIDYSSIGFSKSHREEVGYYAYINTMPGSTSHNISLTIPNQRSKLLLGIRSWCAEDQINLVKLYDLNPMQESTPPEDVNILFSVDVEALPGRAPDRYIDRLIWGGGHGPDGHGVGRLAHIFNKYNVKATFYIDFATSCIHGDDGLVEAARYLDGKSQDVQLHVHSEVLFRNQHWVHAIDAIPTFALHSYSSSKRAIDFAVEKYVYALGKPPIIFRAGGLWWTTDSVLATEAAGIEASSNVSPSRAFCPSTDVFEWENGLVELPVDLCLDPYIQNGCENLRRDAAEILLNKRHNFISCYLHSWSLSPRTSEGYHLDHSEKHQRNLEEAIGILKSFGSTALSNTEYVKSINKIKLNKIPLTWCDKHISVKQRPVTMLDEYCVCNICGAYLFKNKLKNDICPYCRLRTRHRILRSVLDRQIGDIFSGKRVIANNADPKEKETFFPNALSIVNFDVRPLEYLDCVADVQNLDGFSDGSFDVFYSIYVLNHVKDDTKALSEMARVLSPGGIALIMVPFRIKDRTRLHSDITQNYGKDALEKYGVGSYRYYGYDDILELLQSQFNVLHYFAIDPLTGQHDCVFVCRKSEVLQ